MRQQALAWWRGLTWHKKCAIIQEQALGGKTLDEVYRALERAVETRTAIVDKSSIQIERVFRAAQEKEN